MSEFIVIQVGQCGNQIGSAFWPLALFEHGICVDNVKPSVKKMQDEAMHSFFKMTSSKRCFNLEDLKKHKVKARAILIDMEKSVVERFHNSKLRDLFERTYSLTDAPGSGNNWAFGHYEGGRAHGGKIRELIRQAAEECTALHGFLVFFSLSGGTGSGLGTAVLSYLHQDFPYIDRIGVCVHPGQHRDVVTSPYNVAFSLGQLVEHATCVLPVDNKALNKICGPNKKIAKDPFTSDPYQKVNGIIVRMLLNLTSGSRFSGSLNFDLSDLPTNLVPYRGMHFIASSLSPISFSREAALNIVKRKKEIFNSVCNEDHHLLQVNSLSGRVYSAALLARGDIAYSTLVGYQESFLNKLKRAPMGVTLGLSSVPPHDFPVSLLLLTNSSSMSSFFKDSLNDFNTLFSRKAYVHHYMKVDEFGVDEFETARETLMNQIEIYSKCYDTPPVPRFKIER